MNSSFSSWRDHGIETRTFETLPSVLKLHYPEEAYFFAALSLDNTSESARIVLNNVMKRTATCKTDSLFHDEWLLVRKCVASVEGKDAEDKEYLSDILSVQTRLGELITQAHPFRFLTDLHSISRSSLQKFLMAEHAYNHFENTGGYVGKEDARSYALREMEVYIPLVRKMIDIK